VRIKSLELFGFKSFVDKTAIAFALGVTAVVGPNGCGKSNVVDAIRWAMGEQSPRRLRGRGMEDVIFSGSEDRSPVNMAEVVLTFDNGDGDGPPAFSAYREIQVARYQKLGNREVTTNAQCAPALIEQVAALEADAVSLLKSAAEAMRLSARGYHRVLKVARTLADLDGVASVGRIHLAEALSYRALGDRLAAAA